MFLKLYVNNARIILYSSLLIERGAAVLQMNSSMLEMLLIVGMMSMGLLAMVVRLKASLRPITLRKIVMPPLGMSTGLIMFILPATRTPVLWGFISFMAGWLFFSYPLIRSTTLTKVQNDIFITRSRSFLFVFICLFFIRVILHHVVHQYITFLQTGGLFFLLAFGTVIRWRMYMWKMYKQTLRSTLTAKTNC